ncbi:MAG TPA: hypothetical protein DEA55_07930 [Rhodospirillaceae bacterium]|nr:hypothetical protein [Rhodospirillaceae bacterium]
MSTGTIYMTPGSGDGGRDIAGSASAPLTAGGGHAGRKSIHQAVQLWLDGHEGQGNACLLAVGIDRLSLFNEAFGAEYADRIIDETGRHLKALAGQSAHVTRIGGDTFGVFVEKMGALDMATIADHMLNGFYEMSLRAEMGPVRVGVSIGGLEIADRKISAQGLLAKAEAALRAAKDQGRGCFVSYAEMAEQGSNYRSMLAIGDNFLKAIKDHRVRLAFQPVVDAKTRAVSFYECLVRIIGENGNLMTAAEFIPAVEELGLARVLDRYTMHLAIQEPGMFPDINLSVNVSNWSLTDPQWLSTVVGALEGRRDVAERLIIEITESTVMQDIKKTAMFIGTLKKLGCRIALDDFGAGYTAFSQLKTLDIDIVKIDGSYVRGITDTEESRLFVRALQSLADGIDIETVGEGAETKGEADLLVGDGVGHIQGFYCGRPSTERLWLSPGHIHREFPIDASLIQAADEIC